MRYFFLFGNTPALSLAELTAVFKVKKITATIDATMASVGIVTTDAPIDCLVLLEQLGGTVKCGEVVASQPLDKHLTPASIVGWLAPQAGSKFSFGFSVYKEKSAPWRVSRDLGLAVKKLLKEQGVSSRYVISSEPTLSSVVVAKNRLLKNGAELCFIVGDEEVLVGKTLAVQRFGEYSRFDVGRPERDLKSGMLPPKVAKMMINLAGHDSATATLLDPFCGSGTILAQAALLGYQQLIGSDVSAKAIHDTTANFLFLSSHFSSSPTPRLYTIDVTHLTNQIKPASVDVIVTEPYLGPPLSRAPRPEQTKKIVSELTILYRATISEMAAVLRTSGRLVMIFPVIANQKTSIICEKSWLAKHGLIMTASPILYQRAGQQVAREIIVFEKK